MNIVTPNLDQLMTKVDSRYTLVALSAKRARSIVDGIPAFAEQQSTKEVSNAMEEIYEDKITFQRNENSMK